MKQRPIKKGSFGTTAKTKGRSQPATRKHNLGKKEKKASISPPLLSNN